MKELYTFHLGWFNCDLKRLTFLGQFLTECTPAQSLTEIGNILGKTRAGVRYMFNQDDMYIQDIHTIVEHFGYELEFAYQDSTTNQKTNSEIQNNTEDEEDSDVIIMLPSIEKKKLDFLKKAISDRRLSVRKFSSITGLAPATIKKRFEKDDCLVSYIYDVARLLGYKLVIKFEKRA